MGTQILVVDDEPALIKLMIRFLERKGLIVDFAESGKEALAKLEANSYKILVTDLHLPDTTGEELAIKAKILHPKIINILISGSGNAEVRNPTIFDSILEKGGSLNALVDQILMFVKRENP